MAWNIGMPSPPAGLSTSPEDFGIAQPPESGLQEAERASQQIQNQISGEPTPFQRGLNALRDMGARMAAETKVNQLGQIPPFGNLQFKSNGTVTATDVPIDVFQDLMQARDFQREALGGFAQQAQQIQTELKRAQAQPWQQLGTALAANMANQPGMPAWVRGLGATAAQMNPTVDQLRAQYLGVMGKGSDIAKGVRAEDIAEQRTIEDQKQRESAEALRAETARRLAVERAIDNHKEAIKAGTGVIDANAILDSIATAGATPNELASASRLLGTLAAEKKREWDTARSDKAAAEERAAKNLALQEQRVSLLEKAAIGKATEKSEEQKDLEALAQSLAARELTALRTVASMRGGRRERVFRLAREIDPTFNTAEIERKISMEQSFTVGKDGIGLQSFDTFLQHAGEAKSALENLRLSGSPAFNKPINWMRRNMAGSPELEALEVSLEPVKKEFEKFLLNQQALYAEDRKEAQKMLNSSMSPAQLLAGLNQMAKTAKDRYAAMNQRYKRVMGQDIEHPFSNEAISAASAIGINLGAPAPEQPKAGNTVNVTEDELRKLGFK